MTRGELAGALAIAALSVALYLPTLRHGYALDDVFVVAENPVVAELRWREALGAPWWPPQHGVDWRASNWRPLATLSLLAERAAARSAAPRLHHATNALVLALPILGGWDLCLRASPVGAFAWLAAVATWLPTSGLAPTGSGVALRFRLASRRDPRGGSYRAVGRSREALADLERALERSPALPEADRIREQLAR